MDNQFLAAPRRGRARVAVAVVAVVVAFGAGFVVRMVPHHRQGGGAQPAALATSPTPVPDLVGAATAVPDAAPSTSPGPLRLVSSSRSIDGVPLGYPHTLAGAVSACVAWTTLITSNLDPDQAFTIARLISDGTDGPPQRWTNAPIVTRKILGLATSGPIPSSASAVGTPAAYQVRDVTPDSMTVLILAFYTLHSDSYPSTSSIGVWELPVVWTGTDWKIHKRADNAPSYDDLRLEPGSTEAIAAGWLDLVA